MTDHAAPELNDLMLQFHAGAATVDIVAFRLWALAALAARLRFDGAIWGCATECPAAYVHRTHASVLAGAGGVAMVNRILSAAPGRVVSLGIDDGSSSAVESNADTGTEADNERDNAADADTFAAHARTHGLMNAIVVRFDDIGPYGGQFLALRRGASEEPFDAYEMSIFELLAPHLLLAYSTCRKLHLIVGDGRGERVPVRASALVDRPGRLHECDARFVRTLRLEWADWPGRRLPDALLNHKARKITSRWQFLGRQVVIDFLPVNELSLLVARPRLPVDALTAREWEIARRYAGGSEYKEVAAALQVAPATVRSHLRRVFSKLNVSNKAQLSAAIG